MGCGCRKRSQAKFKKELAERKRMITEKNGQEALDAMSPRQRRAYHRGERIRKRTERVKARKARIKARNDKKEKGPD